MLYSTLAEKRAYFRVVMDLFQDLMMMFKRTRWTLESAFMQATRSIDLVASGSAPSS